MSSSEQMPSTGQVSSRESVRRWVSRAGTIVGVSGFLYLALTNGTSGAEEGRIGRGLQEQLALGADQITVRLPFDTFPYDDNERLMPRAFIEGLGCTVEVDYLPPEPGQPPLQLIDTTLNDDPLDGWRLMQVLPDGLATAVTAEQANQIISVACNGGF